MGGGREVETAADRELCHLCPVHCQLLLSAEDRESLGSLMTVDPVLDRHPSPLIVVPLPHQGGVAGATGVGRAGLVRGPAAEGRRQLEQEGEVGQRP
jgi:hypothetical protein